MSALDVKFRGYAELQKTLRGISDEAIFKGGKAALRKGAKKIADQAKSNFEKIDDSKTIEKIPKNVGIQWASKTARQTGNLVWRVGIIGGAKQYINDRRNRKLGRANQNRALGGTIARKGGGPGGDTFYWRFLEFGTEKIGAKKPMRGAADQKGADSLQEFYVQLDKEIRKYMNRQRRAGR